MTIARITSNTTTTITAASCLLHSLRLVISGTPTDWVVKVQNKATPANIFYIAEGFDAPTTIEVPFPQSGDRSIPVAMTGGIDIVTSGTAGVLDAWVDARKSNQ